MGELKGRAYAVGLLALSVGCSQANSVEETEAQWPELSVVGSAGEGLAPDLSCLGAAPAASSSLSAIEVRAPLVAFGSSDQALAGVDVDVFLSSPTPTGATCSLPGCARLKSDASGELSIELPANRAIAYRVSAAALPGDRLLESYEVGVSREKMLGSSAHWKAISAGSLGLIGASAGAMINPQSGALLGDVSDCQGRPLAGAVVRVFDSAGAENLPTTDALSARSVYFDGSETPTLDPGVGSFTAGDGRFAMVNLRSANAARVEIWGRRPGAGQPELIACQALPVSAGAVAMLELAPADTAAPASCGSVPPATDPGAAN